MALNDWVELQNTLVPPAPPKDGQQVNHGEQVNIGLEFAKRQAEKVVPEQKPIPPAGAVAVPN